MRWVRRVRRRLSAGERTEPWGAAVVVWCTEAMGVRSLISQRVWVHPVWHTPPAPGPGPVGSGVENRYADDDAGRALARGCEALARSCKRRRAAHGSGRAGHEGSTIGPEAVGGRAGEHARRMPERR